MTNYLDQERPVANFVCDACWTTSGDGVWWTTFYFKHLKPTLLCPTCEPKERPRMLKLQAGGY